MQTDDNYDVRIAATNALGSLGRGGARQALPNIEGMLRPAAVRAADQRDRRSSSTTQMKDGDYRRALRDAQARIERLGRLPDPEGPRPEATGCGRQLVASQAHTPGIAARQSGQRPLGAQPVPQDPEAEPLDEHAPGSPGSTCSPSCAPRPGGCPA